MTATMVAHEADALETLVQTHARFVYQVAYAVTRNHHDAEDAAQETFLRVLRHREEIQDVRDLRGWLARIAWRIAVDRQRRVAGEPRAESDGEGLDELPALAAGAERTVITAQMLGIADRLVAALPAELRDVLTLSTLEEMTSGEIATVVGIAEASVRTRLLRARQMVKEKMAALLEAKERRR